MKQERCQVYPDTVLVRAVLEGKIAEERAFVTIIREAVRELGCKRDIDSLFGCDGPSIWCGITETALKLRARP